MSEERKLVELKKWFGKGDMLGLGHEFICSSFFVAAKDRVRGGEAIRDEGSARSVFPDLEVVKDLNENIESVVYVERPKEFVRTPWQYLLSGSRRAYLYQASDGQIRFVDANVIDLLGNVAMFTTENPAPEEVLADATNPAEVSFAIVPLKIDADQLKPILPLLPTKVNADYARQATLDQKAGGDATATATNN